MVRMPVANAFAFVNPPRPQPMPAAMAIPVHLECVVNAQRPAPPEVPPALGVEDLIAFVRARNRRFAVALEWHCNWGTLQSGSLAEFAMSRDVSKPPYKYVSSRGELLGWGKKLFEVYKALFLNHLEPGRRLQVRLVQLMGQPDASPQVQMARRVHLAREAYLAQQAARTPQHVRAPVQASASEPQTEAAFERHLWQRNRPLLVALQWSRLPAQVKKVGVAAFAEQAGLGVAPPSAYVRQMGAGSASTVVKHERAAFDWSRLPPVRRHMPALEAIAAERNLAMHDLLRYVPARELLFAGMPGFPGELDDAARQSANRAVIRHVQQHCPQLAKRRAWKAAVAWVELPFADKLRKCMGPFASEQGVHAAWLKALVTFDGEITAFALRPGRISSAPGQVLVDDAPPSPDAPHAGATLAGAEFREDGPARPATPVAEVEVQDEAAAGATATTDPVDIKDEPVEVPRHRYDNHGPILWTPEGEDALVAALQPPQKRSRTEDRSALIDRQTVHEWSLVGPALAAWVDHLPEPARKEALKTEQARIAQEARAWLAMSGEERVRRWEATLCVVSEGEKGQGVRAARDIAAREVLGPYGGTFLRTPAQLQRELDLYGRHNVEAYLYGTQAGSRAISGFPLGNVLSMINEGDSPADNNAGVIRLGNNVTFFVALRAIARDERVCLDYGPTYDRAGWRSHPIEVRDDGSDA